MFRTTILGILGSLVLCSSCRVDPQSRFGAPAQSLPVPPLEDHNLPSYNQGIFVVWSLDVTSQNLAQVLERQRVLEQAHAEQWSYAKEHLLEPAKQWLTLRDEMSRMDRERRRPSSSKNWWSDLASKFLLDVASRKSESFLFELYCESKIWERALDPRFVSESYSARPTPALVCEPFYETSGLLSESQPSCEQGKDISVPGNYFSCLWQEGVLKTKLFSKYRYGDQDVSSNAIRDLSTAKLQNLLSTFSGRRFARDFLRARTLRVRLDGEREYLIAGSKLPEIVGPDGRAAFEGLSPYDIVMELESREQQGRRLRFADDQFDQNIRDQLAAMFQGYPRLSQNEFLFNHPFSKSNTLSKDDIPAASEAIFELFPELNIAEASRLESELTEIDMAHVLDLEQFNEYSENFQKQLLDFLSFLRDPEISQQVMIGASISVDGQNDGFFFKMGDGFPSLRMQAWPDQRRGYWSDLGEDHQFRFVLPDGIPPFAAKTLQLQFSQPRVVVDFEEVGALETVMAVGAFLPELTEESDLAMRKNSSVSVALIVSRLTPEYEMVSEAIRAWQAGK